VVSVHGRVQIGRDVLIAEYTCIHDNDHVFADPSLPITRQGFSVGTVVVGDGCWIGSGAKLLKNSRLGARSILGAGAVLTKSIPEGVVAAGVPARVVKMRQESRSPTLGTAP
jgi:acetyltransferase-like isoleucine patch superfamily enzyme